MIENLQQLGEEIKKKRKQKGMSLKEVADKVGCTLQLVWQWEKGISEPRATSIIALKKAIGLDIFRLSTKKSEKEKDCKYCKYCKKKIEGK